VQIIWLGQGGLVFKNDNAVIMVDPYFSDSVGKTDASKHRRSEVPGNLLDVRPDVLIFTHNHLDHYDPETIKDLIGKDTEILVLAPYSVFDDVRKYGGKNNYVMFRAGTVWSENGISFKAVKAEHSDIHAIGVIINDGDKKYYITGDTLYNENIFSEIPDDIHALFLPINGVGNNMNFTDARRFCERVNPDVAIPIHCGLFDDIDMNEFSYEKKIIPEIYKEIEII